jgi:hypothetical protein
MRKLSISALAVLALALAGSAQTTSTSSSQSDTQASATAGQANVQAQSDNSATASQQTQTSRQKGKASSSTSGSASNSNSASGQAGPASLNLDDGSTMNAQLLTSLDAKKSKPGDRVVARTTQDVKQNGQVVLRKGTRLTGHVTQAQARGEGNADSSLGLMFENAVLKNGQDAPIHVAIQALAAAETATSAAMADDQIMSSGSGAGSIAGSGRAPGGGLLGGVGSTAGGTVGAAGSSVGNVGNTANGALNTTTHTAASATGNAGGLNAAGMLSSTSTGVFGLQGLNLNSNLSDVTQGSVVTSSSRNVHLSSGTQMLLRFVNQ